MEKINSFSSRDVKNFIMYSSNDLEEVINFLEDDYSASIDGIFHALISLLGNYEQNKSRIQYLIHLLEQLLEVKMIDELKVMEVAILDFNNKVSDWNLKQKLMIHEPFHQIQGLLGKINSKEIDELHQKKIKYLSYLIFQDRNLRMIENFLEHHADLLVRDENGENIFEILLNRYLFLDERKFDDISYFYKVILLFVNSKYGEIIFKDKEQYFRLIKRTKLEYRAHIIKVMELFDQEFTISLRELEDRYHVNFNFPSVILEEVHQFQLSNGDRYDFTSQECITIDGKDAKCLDDAIYIEKNLDGTYNLYIHIIDIPSFIPYSSLTREEAKKRGETLYLRDNNILLYPGYISYDMCSLVDNVNRNTLTSIYRLDSNFHLIEDSYQLLKGIIRVRHRMTYDEVDQRFEDLGDSSLDQMLMQLDLFAKARRKSNQKKEQYREFQNAISFDPSHESLKIDYSPAANIVHESMVLENYSRAKYLKKLSLPYLYRKLELPSDDFIEEQLRKLRKLDSKYVESEEFLYQLRENYSQAQYTIKPSYHKGMNLSCYSHSSSPSRRYADSEGQYAIYDMIFNKNISDFNIHAWEYRLEQVARQLNERVKMNETFASHYNYLSYKNLIRERSRK